MKWTHELGNVKVRQRIRYFYLIVLLLLWIASVGSNVTVKEGNEYVDFDHVALYILEFNDVPDNYVPMIISVVVEGEGLYLYEPFYNLEDRLPANSYMSAYLNATKTNPGEERFVFSDDALYYTINHYDSFSEITESRILGGYYLFLGVLYAFLIGGMLFLGFIIVVVKEVTIRDMKNDIVLDFKTLLEKIRYLRDKTKYYFQRRKYFKSSLNASLICRIASSYLPAVSYTKPRLLWILWLRPKPVVV